jgi:hypothetical protein
MNKPWWANSLNIRDKHIGHACTSQLKFHHDIALMLYLSPRIGKFAGPTCIGVVTESEHVLDLDIR